jgi:hypothetical protein
MLLHAVAIIVILFFIGVFFYKYGSSADDFRIIQVDFEQLQQQSWSELRTEEQPVIIRGIPAAPVWTAADLQLSSAADAAPLSPPHSRKLSAPVELQTPAAKSAATQYFVEKWIHTWFPQIFHTSPILRSILPTTVQAAYGNQSIHKTTAVWTSIIPTDEEIVVSIALPTAAEYLPYDWSKQRKYFLSTLTKADTPFVGSIKYIDVKVRPGTLLSIPVHWLYSICAVGDAMPYIVVVESHTPISYIASRGISSK